jgi:Secretion system C-terminal sorting domain
MKNKLLLLLAVCANVQLFSQCSIYFNYDNAGNRVKRYYCAAFEKEKIDPSTLIAHQNLADSRTNEFGEQVAVNFVPNPTTGKVYVENLDQVDQKAIDVIDINGKLVSHTHLEANELDLSPLSSGVYYLRYRISNVPKIAKIIKTN